MVQHIQALVSYKALIIVDFCISVFSLSSGQSISITGKLANLQVMWCSLSNSVFRSIYVHIAEKIDNRLCILVEVKRMNSYALYLRP